MNLRTLFRMTLVICLLGCGLVRAEVPEERYRRLLRSSDANFRLGHLHQALLERGQALDLARAQDDAELYAEALFKLAQTDLALGEFQRSRTRFLRSAQLYQKLQEPLSESQCYLELGNLFSLAERHKTASKYYRKSEATLENLPPDQRVEKTRLKARLNLSLLQNNAEASRTTELLQEYLKTHPGPEMELWLGTLLLKTGQLNSSLELLKKARQEFQREGHNLNFLRASLNLAQLKYRSGSPEQALDTLYEALDTLSPEVKLPQELEAKLALLMIRTLPRGQERETWSRLAREWLTGETRRDFILAEVERALDAEAPALAEELLLSLSSATDTGTRARQDLAWARLHQSQGQQARAGEQFRNLAKEAEAHGFFDLAWRARIGLAALLKEERPQEALEQFEAALKSLEKVRGQLTQAELRRSFSQDKKPLYDDMLSLSLELGDIERAFEISERGRARSLLDQLRVEGLPSRGQNPLTVAQIRQRLPKDTVLLSYWIGAEECTLFLLKREGLRFRKLDLTPSELRELVERVRPRDWYDARQLPAFDEQASERLYRALIPSSELLPGQTLLLIPDGPLHQLSFAALKAQNYLVETYPLLYSPSASVATSFPQDDGLYERVMVFAAPEELPSLPDSTGSRNELLPLPYTEQEALAIQTHFPKAVLKTGPEASESSFYAATSGVDIDALHFATHSYVNNRDPLLSGLLLQKQAPPHHDGLLLAAEIFKLSLRAKLVVLSSCHSGRGKLFGAEGVIGLVRAFQSAGVPRVVASLWQISDRSTAQLMESFYASLSRGLPPAKALRSAQLEALKSEFAHPYQWAAFVVHGTAQ